MSARAKRRWFQLHLSTCLILVVLAGLLIWGNTTVTLYRLSSAGPEESGPDIANFELGWPCCFLERKSKFSVNAGEGIVAHPISIQHLDLTGSSWRIDGLLINLAVALSTLAATALLCEWVIRRKPTNE